MASSLPLSPDLRPSTGTPSSQNSRMDAAPQASDGPDRFEIRSDQPAESTSEGLRSRQGDPVNHERVASTSCTVHSVNANNLVVCLDGTANQFSVKNTNIVELYGSLDKSDKQLTYYNSGIGTYVKESWWLKAALQQADHTIDMMIAWHFKRSVLKVYQWLSENYVNGDRIFIYGFSRGAYQARVIAGMIERVGLVHKGNNDQIAFAYELYIATIEGSRRNQPASQAFKSDGISQVPVSESDFSVPKDSRSVRKAKRHCIRFKETLSRENVKVHFVGAWDTVSSIGVFRGQSLPETTTGMGHVCAFRHALALDERRVKFLPEYASGGIGTATGSNVKEVWFAGTHSDIGGGNVENMELDKFGPALRWMIYESIQHGLRIGLYSPKVPFKDEFEMPNRFERWYRHVRGHAIKVASSMGLQKRGEEIDTKARATSDAGPWSTIDRPTRSLRGLWWALEFAFMRRLVYTDQESTTHWPNCGRPRVVHREQLVHRSVFDAIGRAENAYLPRARISDGTDWKNEELEQLMCEDDPYLSVGRLLPELRSGLHQLPSVTANALLDHASRDIGLRSIVESPGSLDIIFSCLEATVNPDKYQNLFDLLTATLSTFPRQPITDRKFSYTRINKIFSVTSADCKSKSNQTLDNIGQWPFYGNTSPIISIALSEDASCLASGSADGTIFIWNAQTGDPIGEPLKGHTSTALRTRQFAFGTEKSAGKRQSRFVDTMRKLTASLGLTQILL
ncbi:hypothetical protein HGRIS_011288 [Hohenbuehelia grisea]|uniref:T6SS Phospholipase effector Tle1-like catalytic domain-containing protein n=1 Tax=Hohenbuehelia grisea TaxID=104357 RepID=A0ABR3JWS6_9AGAR